jgi:hypothetical protein
MIIFPSWSSAEANSGAVVPQSLLIKLNSGITIRSFTFKLPLKLYQTTALPHRRIVSCCHRRLSFSMFSHRHGVTDMKGTWSRDHVTGRSNFILNSSQKLHRDQSDSVSRT